MHLNEKIEKWPVMSIIYSPISGSLFTYNKLIEGNFGFKSSNGFTFYIS